MAERLPREPKPQSRSPGRRVASRVSLEPLSPEEQIKQLYASISAVKAVKLLKRAGVLTPQGNLRALFR